MAVCAVLRPRHIFNVVLAHTEPVVVVAVVVADEGTVGLHLAAHLKSSTSYNLLDARWFISSGGDFAHGPRYVMALAM